MMPYTMILAHNYTELHKVIHMYTCTPNYTKSYTCTHVHRTTQSHTHVHMYTELHKVIHMYTCTLLYKATGFFHSCPESHPSACAACTAIRCPRGLLAAHDQCWHSQLSTVVHVQLAVQLHPHQYGHSQLSTVVHVQLAVQDQHGLSQLSRSVHDLLDTVSRDICEA
eukprot:scpid90215/ scgid13960/ 